jgi:hypothetical protein
VLTQISGRFTGHSAGKNIVLKAEGIERRPSRVELK